MLSGRLSCSTSARRGLLVICYQKRRSDAKKSKKSEPPQKQVDNQGGPSEPAKPPRITDTGPRSLKSQLRLVRSFQPKETQPNEGRVGVRQKYSKPREVKAAPTIGAEAIRPKRILRPELNPSKQERARKEKQKPLTEEELKAKAAKEEARARYQKIAALYHKRHHRGQQAALIIDGYNVMMQWIEEPGQSQMKQAVGSSLNLVRDAFLQDISSYSSKDLKVTVAFDAIGNLSAPPLAREVFGGIEVVWVQATEADAFISLEATSLRRDGCPYVLVASNDHDVTEACWKDEIFPMSCMQLLHEIRREKKAYQKFKAERAMQTGGKNLGSRMLASSPQMFMHFEQMRRGKQRK